MTNQNQDNIPNAKPEKAYLWWKDARTERCIPAGVAFYEAQYGEYRLKLDFLQAMDSNGSQLYLRSIGIVDGQLMYRAETVVKKDGKYAGRRVVGEGYSSAETNGEVHINLGPFERLLVLSTTQK
ncbi:MAG: hypothetical protein JST16_03770 [Bdellovibrionales bacterium]|nr:hypothetical protein [Bdellovibrionales bacterium]